MTVRRTDGNGRAQVLGALCQTPDRPSQTSPRMPPLVKRLYTVREAASYLSFKSPWGVLELMWRGDLPYVQMGRRRVAFDVHDLDRFVEERKTREVPGVF